MASPVEQTLQARTTKVAAPCRTDPRQVLWKEEDDDDDFFMSQESVVREEEDEAMMALSHMSSPKTRFGRGGEEGDDAQDIYGGA